MTPALRTSGFVRALEPESLRTLLLLLTFLSPNGDCLVLASQLAEALGVSERTARERLRRLQEHEWHGQSVLLLVPRGAEAVYVPSPKVLGQREEPVIAAIMPEEPSHRAAVVAQSRERYARPRQEVEREIAQSQGWDQVETKETETDTGLLRRLVRLGVPERRAQELLARYGPDAVLKQLLWLPYRRAQDPARLVVAAIEGDYGEPLLARRQHREARVDAEAE